MPISAVELIEEFGRAAELGNAAVFVGAGLSRSAGLPDWAELLRDAAAIADVPLGPDLPLAAEYLVLSRKYSREQLAGHIREKVMAVGASPTSAHQHLSRLPVDQMWTTNYDGLIEAVCPGSQVVVADDDVARIGAAHRTVVKMHGSISDTGWAQRPVITRTDYETYQGTHPRMWALLRATYLSRTMLFLGFSFTDPNIDILLQLARTLGTSVGDRHVTVIRRPSPASVDDCRLHDLRVRDLEASGVRVHEVADYSELDDLLASLVRRTRPRRLFVAGSFPKGPDSEGLRACRAVAAQLAHRPGWTLVSLGGPSGWHVSQQVAEHRRAESCYEASDYEFHFRKSSVPLDSPAERLGAAFHHDRSREELLPILLADCRAMVVVGGQDRTAEEIVRAESTGVGIVPIGSSGGTAATYWNDMRLTPPDIGGQPTPIEVWERLGHANPAVAAKAALDLLDRAMYHAHSADHPV
jgi:hypothetical protein